MSEKSIHSGHRQRLKEGMLASNFNGISDINLLEAVLFYSIHRSDTNEIAHALLNAFGSVEAVFEADYEDLKQVKGIGDNSAFLIKLIGKTAKRINTVDTKKAVFIGGNNDAAQVLLPYFISEKAEVLVALCLDNSGKLIRVSELARGVVNCVSFDNRKLMEAVVRSSASTVILAHNHPHGLPNPSREDLKMTGNAREVLELVGVSLYDHLIYADGHWRSIRELPDACRYLTRIEGAPFQN